MAFGRFCDPANLSANELVGVANNALSVINVDPYIRSIHDITPTFVLDLSVVLFGSDVLPCPDSVDADCVENFEAVVSKLSHEIGEDLDHILPEELMVGEPQALFDFLVLLCAFIVYCGEMDLLKLHGLGSESHSFTHVVYLPTDLKLDLETKEYPEFQLSTSPELPRHSVVCAPTTLSSSFHQSDRFMEQSTPLKRTPASFQTRNSLHPGDSMNSLLKTNLFTFQPDNMKTNHPIASCLPSLLDIHANSSPPATPNAMNAYLEISPSNSPDAVVPSLKNSPNIQQQVIRSSSVDKFEETNKPTSPVTDSSKDLFGSKNSIISMDSVCVNVSTAPPHVRSSAHEHKVRLSTPPDRDNGNNISVSSSIELVHKSISDKHDSSSSGRGRSLTATQTVPCQSNGSVPSSLLELHTFPGSPNTSHAVVISPEYSRKHTSNDKIDGGGSISSNCDSVGTSSILAWDQDRIKQKRKIDKSKRLDGSLDELTSILSTSLASDPDKTMPSRLASDWPTTSEILAETNNFAHVLEKRLQYLRSVYIRAHSEAEALANLAQLITSGSLSIIPPMNDDQIDCNICHNNKEKNNSSILKSNSSDVYEKHSYLESLLVKAIDRIDLLLKSNIHAKSILDTSNHQIHSVDYHDPKSMSPSTAKIAKTGKYSPSKDIHSFQCNLHQDDKLPLDLELEKLMNLKHEYMMKAFHLCLDQLHLLTT